MGGLQFAAKAGINFGACNYPIGCKDTLLMPAAKTSSAPLTTSTEPRLYVSACIVARGARAAVSAPNAAPTDSFRQCIMVWLFQEPYSCPPGQPQGQFYTASPARVLVPDRAQRRQRNACTRVMVRHLFPNAQLPESHEVVAVFLFGGKAEASDLEALRQACRRLGVCRTSLP